jgi:hypothetical protein
LTERALSGRRHDRNLSAREAHLRERVAFECFQQQRAVETDKYFIRIGVSMPRERLGHHAHADDLIAAFGDYAVDSGGCFSSSTISCR